MCYSSYLLDITSVKPQFRIMYLLPRAACEMITSSLVAKPVTFHPCLLHVCFTMSL